MKPLAMNTRKSSGNIFRDLGFEREEAENLRIRALLMTELVKFIEREGISQAEAARRMGVTQPRISDLVRGKINVFSVDMLISMLSMVGMRVRVKVHAARAKAA